MGVLFSVLISSAAMASALAAIALIGEGPSEAAHVWAAAALGFLAAYLLIGLPAHAVLQRTGRRSFVAYLLTGAVVGLVLTPLAEMLDTDAPPDPSGHAVFWSAALISLFSGAAACVFWLVLNRFVAKLRGEANDTPAA